MPVRNASSVVTFDADAALDATEATVSGTLRSFVEFDRESFNPLYVDDTTLGLYEDEAHMREHFAQLHAYVYLDLTEVDLFTEELFPIAEEVDYITTALNVFKLVRIYRGEEGLFVALDRTEPVQPVVDAVARALSDDEAA